MTPATESALAQMRAAGLPEHEAREWSESFPVTTGDFEADTRDSSTFWRRATSLLRRLPLKPRRSEAEQAAADALMLDARASRESFLAAHVDPHGIPARRLQRFSVIAIIRHGMWLLSAA